MNALIDKIKIKENLFLAPVLHESLFFTLEINKLLKELKPDTIALELPGWMKDIYIKAVKSLPEVTAITYENRKQEMLYLSISPLDPFVEAVRYCLENQVELQFIDSDAISYYEHHDPYPESFFIEQQTWFDFICHHENQEFKKTKEDNLREQTMGYYLHQLQKKSEKVLGIIGMSHYQGVLSHLDAEVVSIFSSYNPKPSVHHIAPKDLSVFLDDYPIVYWLYEHYRKGTVFNTEKNQVKNFGAFKLLEGSQGNYDEKYKEVAQKIYAKERIEKQFLNVKEYDRRHLIYSILKEASKLYKVRYKEEFYSWQLKNTVKLARNISFLENRILPSFFTLIESAKANVDDNYAWELMQLLGFYDFQPESSYYPNLDLKTLGQYKSMFVRRRDKKQVKNPIKNRKKQSKDEDWSKKFDRGDICSHQPEDIIIENFADFIKLKAKRHLLSELVKSEKFSTSFFEGIDIKETIRKQDGIYVKKFEKLQGEVGNVVFIFDSDIENNKYAYKMTWLGEHEQESDMAFYSTEIREDIIGPGISRCEYGGFMLSYPPGRLYDVWSDPDYQFFKKKEEKLLIAAIDYSLKRYVVYVASKPPRSKIVSWGKKNGIDVVYIPLGSLSKSTINKIKIFHVLANHSTRDYADDYIF